MQSKISIHSLQKMKQQGKKIVVFTAYDSIFARIFDQAGLDVLLVGDSLGMVIQGESSTLPVTMDQMVYHCRAVSRSVQQAHVVADLPFMSYQISSKSAVKNAGRLVAEGGAQGVKLEGGESYAPTVEKIVRAGIPVMGHIGLTPQSVLCLGGYVVQGRDEANAKQLIRDAVALQSAGVYALVLEGIPADLAGEITRQLSIPTIGIGAGAQTDGQVLVSYDALGLNPQFQPKFVKQYANLWETVANASQQFLEEVKAGTFPSDEHSYK